MIALTQRLNERDDAVRQREAGRDRKLALRSHLPNWPLHPRSTKKRYLPIVPRFGDLRWIEKQDEGTSPNRPYPKLSLAFAGRG